MPFTRIFFLIITLFAIACASTPALSAEDEMVHAMFEPVRDLRLREEYGQAIEMLHGIIEGHPKSDDIVRRAYTELVFTYVSKGDEVTAEETARSALYRFPDIEPDDTYIPRKVGAMFDDLRARMFGSCMIETTPDSCHVWFDGDSVGLSPVTLELVRAGEHVLNLRKPGYTDLSKNVFVGPGSRTDVLCALSESPDTTWPDISPKSGAGVGVGIVTPLNEMETYANAGSAVSVFGWHAFTEKPTVLVRGSIGGMFFNGVNTGSIVIDSLTYAGAYGTSTLRLALTLELSYRLGRVEPYIGAGGGFYRVWVRLRLNRWEDYTQIQKEEYIGRNNLGVTFTGGLKAWLRPNVALDFNVQYDRANDMAAYTSPDERVVFDYESVTVFVIANIGRMPRRSE